jgi:hypothetical protein
MPSVYDFRHVELDKVGRGKRVIQAPGGSASNIFGPNGNAVNGSEGSDLNSIDSGSLSSLPSTPVNGINGSNGNIGHFFGDAMSECSTPPSSASSSRRGSRQEDTKNRLFGPEVESPRRRVVDRMKSNIFSENNTNGTNGTVLQRSASVKKYDFVIRRNPITGEVYDEPNPKMNGHNTNGINGKVNGVNNSGSASLPTTPVRVRQPPGIV